MFMVKFLIKMEFNWEAILSHLCLHVSCEFWSQVCYKSWGWKNTILDFYSILFIKSGFQDGCLVPFRNSWILNINSLKQWKRKQDTLHNNRLFLDFELWVTSYEIVLRCEFIFHFEVLDLKCELHKTIYQLRFTFNSFMMEILIPICSADRWTGSHISDCNGTQTHNHIICKRTLN